MRQKLFLLGGLLVYLSVLAGEASASPAGTTMVSVDSSGNQHHDGGSYFSAISANGRYVAFLSTSASLVPNDTNDTEDIFLHDLQTGETSRISVDTNGVEGNATSYGWPAVSADGRFVAFVSLASNLVEEDTNGQKDVFVRDRETLQTTRISIASDGSQGDDDSDSPAISADGRYVAFVSTASNLVPEDTNLHTDVFVRDRQAETTTRVAVASDGSQGNGHSVRPAISADGRYVAFWSQASNLVPGDTNEGADIFVHDCQTGQTTRVSVASHGSQVSDVGEQASPALSEDARFVAFNASSPGLVAGDTNGVDDVFVHDRITGLTTRVSVASDGSEANDWSYRPHMSADGRFVAFRSAASNLISGDTNGVWDVFVHDRLTGETKRVSVAWNGAQANSWNDESSISADGNFIAFSSNASNLVSGDTYSTVDVFVRDGGSPAVGGVAELPDSDSLPTQSGGSPQLGWLAAAAAILLVVSGGWYTRHRHFARKP
jgi:Tol biopolymer transport system component